MLLLLVLQVLLVLLALLVQLLLLCDYKGERASSLQLHLQHATIGCVTLKQEKFRGVAAIELTG